ncbi:hypothetical protein HWV62_45105 [Athelia sp. TMB]|nr:hypothetical protein HWV62_45105 [Athelia sp. TMB]
MSPRPQRTTRPTERAAATQKKSDTVEKRAAAKSGSKSSSAKRKAARSSSPEVQIVETASPATKSSPSKTRVRPSLRADPPVTPSSESPKKERRSAVVRDFPSSVSPPATPSPIKHRAGTTVHGTSDRKIPASNVKARKVPLPSDRNVSSDDDPFGGPPEADEVTDPNFFDDQASDGIADKGADSNSEEYWGNVDSVHESDMRFIDDSAVVAEDDPSSDDHAPIPPSHRSAKYSKAKVSQQVDDDLSDHSRRERSAAKKLGKGKAAAPITRESSSEVEGPRMSKQEQVELAEAKRRSLAVTASPNRVGSSSNRPQVAHQDNPEVYSSKAAADMAPRQSKILKAMDRSAAAVVKQSPMKLDNDTVYMEDFIVGVRGEACPAQCEVKNSEDEDPGISYVDLCNLLSWSDAPHMGLGTYSGWSGQCPNIDMDQLKLLFEFTGFGHILNPSRTTPSTLSAMAIPGRNHVLIKAGSRDTIVQFATVLFVTENSQLHSLLAILSENRRTIKGVPQIVEWERMQAVLCMAFNIPYANVDMRAGVITFCTGKTMRTGARSTSTSPVKNPNGFLKKVPAQAPGTIGSSPFAVAKGTVTGNGIIPILDGRGRTFNLEGDLLALDKKLPSFNGEVPEGSCVWVGYTCTKYESETRGIGLNMNLMWVVVIGTP